METIIIDRICTSCRCDKETARKYLDAEVRNLRELCDAICGKVIWNRQWQTKRLSTN